MFHSLPHSFAEAFELALGLRGRGEPGAPFYRRGKGGKPVTATHAREAGAVCVDAAVKLAIVALRVLIVVLTARLMAGSRYL